MPRGSLTFQLHLFACLFDSHLFVSKKTSGTRVDLQLVSVVICNNDSESGNRKLVFD